MTSPATLGELRTARYPDRTVKQELQTNLLTRLRSGAEVFSGLVGYNDSVLPTVERAILAGHDIILLGERGQAKSRLIRGLTQLLDDTVPVVAGCDVNDHPYRPICRRCRDLVADLGDGTPVEWIGRDRRYSEKLATPDTAVADLIGDVDPIRVAEGRYLGDELTIHYGLIPRTNRGIFAVNELPDLPERIQVSLLNILEERDVQVRGYNIRLPLDLVLVASANPEDYTHRGRIITPLKDRFGSQVRTHYPKDVEDEIAIMEQEAAPPPEGIPVTVPQHLKEVVAAFAARLRSSAQVNQRSGVSVRFSIGALEALGASALRRAVRAGEPEAVPRMVDLWSVLPASIGRIEFDSLEEGREPEIVARALKQAIASVWRARLGGEDFDALLERFEAGLTVDTSDSMSSADFLAQFGVGAGRNAQTVPGFDRSIRRLDVTEESPAAVAGALEFTLEGLHLGKRLNKESTEGGGFVFGDT
ncbi:MAG: sigma 54-interacting transcriptional regulator [Actinomycetota bacterium]|nr:sigma 54-interacting transcriptional regulator [Actinomycetota bacterium]